MKHPVPFILLCIYLVLMIALAFDPYDRGTWWAENLPVIIVVALLVATWPVFRFSNTAYCLMWFFLCVHTIGGHFTFARVPFDYGNQLLSMTGLDSLFPEGRNNFDRFGHFLVGVFGYPVAELAYRKKWVNGIAMAVVLGIFALGFWGALYEVIEMIYAVEYGGDQAADFLGSQGDIWDAQKDMALDILGAMLSTALFAIVWRGRPNYYREDS